MFPGTMSVLHLRLIPHRLRLAALPPQANCLDANPLPQESAQAQPAPPSENKRAGLQWDSRNPSSAKTPTRNNFLATASSGRESRRTDPFDSAREEPPTRNL